MEKRNQVSLVEELFYLAGAFKSAIDGGFFAREHASAIFKSVLREGGYEVTKKQVQQEE